MDRVQLEIPEKKLLIKKFQNKEKNVGNSETRGLYHKAFLRS